MSKIFKKINFSAIAGGLAGGAAASLIETMIPDDLLAGDNKDSKDSKTGEYVKIGIMAIGGSVISSMTKNNLIQGVGNGMLGLAGANLYDLVMSSDTTKPEETPIKTEGIGRLRRLRGIGMLPSQNAVGMLPGQNAVNGVGSAYWIKDKKNQNVY